MKEKPKREDYNDLCTTCKNFFSCIYIKNGNRPVRHCEEFEVYSYRPVVEKTSNSEPAVKEEDQTYTGICKNCDHRETCMNRTPDKIIWHCEEYV